MLERLENHLKIVSLVLQIEEKQNHNEWSLEQIENSSGDLFKEMKLLVSKLDGDERRPLQGHSEKRDVFEAMFEVLKAKMKSIREKTNLWDQNEFISEIRRVKDNISILYEQMQANLADIESEFEPETREVRNALARLYETVPFDFKVGKAEWVGNFNRRMQEVERRREGLRRALNGEVKRLEQRREEVENWSERFDNLDKKSDSVEKMIEINRKRRNQLEKQIRGSGDGSEEETSEEEKLSLNEQFNRQMQERIKAIEGEKNVLKKQIGREQNSGVQRKKRVDQLKRELAALEKATEPGQEALAGLKRSIQARKALLYGVKNKLRSLFARMIFGSK